MIAEIRLRIMKYALKRNILKNILSLLYACFNCCYKSGIFLQQNYKVLIRWVLEKVLIWTVFNTSIQYIFGLVLILIFNTFFGWYWIFISFKSQYCLKVWFYICSYFYQSMSSISIRFKHTNLSNDFTFILMMFRCQGNFLIVMT